MGPVNEHAVRPWGAYTVLAEGEGFKVKTIEVHPGQRLGPPPWHVYRLTPRAATALSGVGAGGATRWRF